MLEYDVAPLGFGNWNNNTNAGVGARNWNNNRNNANRNVSFRGGLLTSAVSRNLKGRRSEH